MHDKSIVLFYHISLVNKSVHNDQWSRYNLVWEKGVSITLTLCWVSTDSTGYSPLAVSPLSMIQSAPSRTALATSLLSARVGRGFLIMLSNIYTMQLVIYGYKAAIIYIFVKSSKITFLYLSGTNDGFTNSVATGNHHFLSQEYFFRGYLNTHVSTGNHDTITGLKNLIKTVQWETTQK